MSQKVKQFMLFMIVLFALSACDSTMPETEVQNTMSIQQVQSINESETQKAFAKILSMAASKDSSVRAFLKNEAEKQYDKDYDVFYPFVKNKVVANGKTFREILVSYSSNKEISNIENNLPFLTIMIPDLSRFYAFSINKWDTSDNQVAVTYAKDNVNSAFYFEGDSILSLPKGDLPNFPFMVVKSNERMKVVGTATTRSGEREKYVYDFADPAYDGSKMVTTRSYRYYEEVNTEKAPEDKPYLNADSIDTRCINAYLLSRSNKYLIDREYVYYNLSPNNSQNGRLDPNVREKIYKFRISPAQYGNITDQEIGEDPKLQKDTYYKKGHPSDEQIAKDLWTDGNFEIVIKAFMGSSSLPEQKMISCKGSDLFYVSKFNVKYQHGTGFRRSKWWYSTTISDLKGKWVDISSSNLYLTLTWDLSNNPVSIYILAFESDKGTTKTESISYTASYTNKADAGLSGGKDTKYNIGFSSQITNQKTFSVSYQYTDQDDNLGSVFLNFKDPIIISDKYASTKGYEVYSLSTGAIDLVIAPTSIRK